MLLLVSLILLYASYVICKDEYYGVVCINDLIYHFYACYVYYQFCLLYRVRVFKGMGDGTGAAMVYFKPKAAKLFRFRMDVLCCSKLTVLLLNLFTLI